VYVYGRRRAVITMMSFVWETGVCRIKFAGGVHYWSHLRQRWQFSCDYYIIVSIIIYVYLHLHFNIITSGTGPTFLSRTRKYFRKSNFFSWFLNCIILLLFNFKFYTSHADVRDPVRYTMCAKAALEYTLWLKRGV